MLDTPLSLPPWLEVLLARLPRWLQAFAGFVSSLGGVGVFVIAFLDSSFLSFPAINDALVMFLSLQAPARMPYYAAMALLGSLAGSAVLYGLARKGGELLFRRRAGRRAEAIGAWFQRNSFLSVALPSMLPPPMPFKAFVLAAGAFGIRWRTFVLALVVGRGLRYFGEGLLAMRYGETGVRYLIERPLRFTLLVLAIMFATYLLTRFLLRARPHPA